LSLVLLASEITPDQREVKNKPEISSKNFNLHRGRLVNARIQFMIVTGTVSLIMVAMTQKASAVATAVFQDGLNGYAGTEDNQILDPGTGFDDANVGGRNAMQLGNASPNSTRRSILRFDVSSLASLSTGVVSAKITLKKVNAAAGPGTDDAEMYAIADNNADWVQGTSIFVVTPGESSWNSKQHGTSTWIGDQPGDPFTSGGGGLLGPLQDTIVGVSSNDLPNTLYTWNLDPALVDQWITGINAGVLIKEKTELDGTGSGTELQIEFGSSEFGDPILDAPQHPKLEITFNPVDFTGDFDSDLDVDGADFLEWQRLFGIVYDADDLTDWQNNYGSDINPLTAAVTSGASAVPEPSTVVLAVMGWTGLLAGRRGKTSKH
jgi:hypothetical protein